jgi:PAS domain S-box-containing protein
LEPHYLSEEFLRIWGFEQQGLPTLETVARRIHPDDRDRVIGEVQTARDEGRDVAIEFRLVLPDGTLKYIQGVLHWVFSPSGQIIELMGTHVDVTERKRAEQERERQRVREFELTLEARVAERTRIARDLHDTLLQSFNGLLPHFTTVARLLRSQPDEARRMLDDTIDQARLAVREGREAVQDLRSSTEEPNNLAEAIGRLAEELSGSTQSPALNAGREHQAVDIRVRTAGESRRLHAIVRDETYRIAMEALRNALQHSQATQIEVELHYDVRHFRLQVRDNGRGIDPELAAAGGREGHFGLQGMRERAELTGGKFTLWSAHGAGTEVEVTIPASRAYAGAHPSERRESG